MPDNQTAPDTPVDQDPGGGLLDPDDETPPSEGFEECAAFSQEAAVLPLNMLIMFDRSGSMQDSRKWAKATEALKAFVQDPESAGLRVALRFFPDEECSEQTCDVNACSVPRIEAAPLAEEQGDADAHEQALVNALTTERPFGNATPIYAALAGAEKWAVNLRERHPDEKAIVILVTDGAPNGCDEDPNAIAGLASEALASHDVLTYGVGLVGAHRDIMNKIAAQGGTEQGFFIGNGDAQGELLAALKEIQDSQVSCEFQMPQSEDGKVLDPSLINVTYTSGGQGESALGQVPNAGACSSSTGGWYYDDPSNPSVIAFCPSTCQVIQADPEAKVEVVVGCGTIPAR